MAVNGMDAADSRRTERARRRWACRLRGRGCSKGYRRVVDRRPWVQRRASVAASGRKLWAEILPQKTLQPFELQGLKNGTPERIRTAGLLIRSQALYPAELRVPCAMREAGKKPIFGCCVKDFSSFFMRIPAKDGFSGVGSQSRWDCAACRARYSSGCWRMGTSSAESV